MKKYKNAAYDDEYIDLLIYNINKKIKEERINKGYSIFAYSSVRHIDDISSASIIFISD